MSEKDKILMISPEYRKIKARKGVKRVRYHIIRVSGGAGDHKLVAVYRKNDKTIVAEPKTSFLGVKEAYEKKISSLSHIAGHSAANRRIYNERKKLGLCIKCGKKAAEKGFVRCPECMKYHRKYYNTKKPQVRKR